MNIAVYCGSSSGNVDAFLQGAIALGKWIGENQHTLVYGGAQTGLMGAVADATLLSGGKVVGVLPEVESILARKHPGLTEYYTTASMAERRSKMIELSDAFIALPGGPGTLDEISEVISLARLGIVDAPCVFADIRGYYQPVRKFLEDMVRAEFVNKQDFAKVLFSEDIREIGQFIENK